MKATWEGLIMDKKGLGLELEFELSTVFHLIFHFDYM